MSKLDELLAALDQTPLPVDRAEELRSLITEVRGELLPFKSGSSALYLASWATDADFDCFQDDGSGFYDNIHDMAYPSGILVRSFEEARQHFLDDQNSSLSSEEQDEDLGYRWNDLVWTEGQEGSLVWEAIRDTTVVAVITLRKVSPNVATSEDVMKAIKTLRNQVNAIDDSAVERPWVNRVCNYLDLASDVIEFPGGHTFEDVTEKAVNGTL